MCFFPQGTALCDPLRIRLGNHPEPMRRLFRFFLAQRDFMPEVPFGLSGVRF